MYKMHQNIFVAFHVQGLKQEMFENDWCKLTEKKVLTAEWISSWNN